MAFHLICTKNSTDDLAPPGTDKPDKAQYFAAFDLKGNIMQFMGIKMVYLHKHISLAPWPFRELHFNRAAHHLRNNIFPGVCPYPVCLDVYKRQVIHTMPNRKNRHHAQH